MNKQLAFILVIVVSICVIAIFSTNFCAISPRREGIDTGDYLLTAPITGKGAAQLRSGVIMSIAQRRDDNPIFERAAMVKNSNRARRFDQEVTQGKLL